MSTFVRLTLLLMALAVTPSVASAQQIFTGRTADRALYELAVPAQWNGELVVYAQGIVDPAAPIQIPDVGPLRDGLLAAGFAFATSSDRENGYNVKDAAIRTHQLRGIFMSKVGQPTRTYLIGHSLGALAVLKLAETYPSQYDGALPMCGLIDGGAFEVQYLGDARVLFDYFFPGVVPGDVAHPADLSFSPGTPAFNAVLAALSAGLFNGKTVQFSAVAGLPGLPDPSLLVQSGMSVVGFNIRFGADLLAHTHDHSPYSNVGVVYQGSANDAALNAGVGRFASHPDAVQYIDHYYESTGALRIPVLTLHTVADPVVPFAHEAKYATKAANAGASDWLVQQSVNRYGHCTFKATEMFNAFQGLVGWVKFGVKPQGGDATVP